MKKRRKVGVADVLTKRDGAETKEVRKGNNCYLSFLPSVFFLHSTSEISLTLDYFTWIVYTTLLITAEVFDIQITTNHKLHSGDIFLKGLS